MRKYSGWIPDQAVRALQYGVREGREAKEAGVVTTMDDCRMQYSLCFAVVGEENKGG